MKVDTENTSTISSAYSDEIIIIRDREHVYLELSDEESNSYFTWLSPTEARELAEALLYWARLVEQNEDENENSGN